MSALPAICRECGNDEVAEGHPYCTECLARLSCTCRYRTDTPRCSVECWGVE